MAIGCAAEDRWVYMPCHFWGKDPQLHSLAFFTNTVAQAKAAGYNGVLLSCHLDLSHQWPPHLVKQLTRAKAFCDAIGMEVIPMTWDVGYGGDCPGNWFESREVANLPYVRRGGKAVFCNVAPMGEGFTMIVAPVTMLDVGLEFGAYRNAIQGWLKPPVPVKDFLKAFSMAGGTHHSALVYDAAIEEIEAFGRMMGFEVVTIR